LKFQSFLTYAVKNATGLNLRFITTRYW
jgi:hypothetical protein